MKIAGIKIENDSKGNPRYARFDLRKHGDAIKPYLETVGVFEDRHKDKDVKYISAEELKKRVHKHIETLPWQK